MQLSTTTQKVKKTKKKFDECKVQKIGQIFIYKDGAHHGVAIDFLSSIVCASIMTYVCTLMQLSPS